MDQVRRCVQRATRTLRHVISHSLSYRHASPANPEGSRGSSQTSFYYSKFLPPKSVSTATSGWRCNFHGKDVVVFQHCFNNLDPTILQVRIGSHHSIG
ncbi:hypothetical protein B296_00016527 [Ensete ventricosum]|uniref:Uncharacterized protein n=1 Tax=Ensete ventricosum TaxID=4639 RepID=A0A426XDL9_ENSVE|nr:hypothetical protein B296_00016527 [Ensete ventricosum]